MFWMRRPLGIASRGAIHSNIADTIRIDAIPKKESCTRVTNHSFGVALNKPSSDKAIGRTKNSWSASNFETSMLGFAFCRGRAFQIPRGAELFFRAANAEKNREGVALESKTTSSSKCGGYLPI